MFLAVADFPTPVNAAVALEVKRDGFGADFPDRIAALHGFIQLERPGIGGKDQDATFGQPLHGQAEEGGVILLDVEGLLAVAGIGKGGRIDEDQSEPLLAVLEPLRQSASTV